MLPRQVARGLKGKTCHEVIRLNICEKECIAKQCWEGGRHVRLDEISGTVPADPENSQYRFILSAIPFAISKGLLLGPLKSKEMSRMRL